MANGCFGKSWWCAVAASVLLACGGSASVDSGGASGTGGGAPGGAPSGGAGAASGAGAAGAPSNGCFYNGKSYAGGERFPASDGCNTCSCQAGLVSCTLLACATGCQYQGQTYQPGERFPVDCNTCTCGADGLISCTEIACLNQCSNLQAAYAAALKQAKACNPTRAQADQCQATVVGALPCGCPEPVNGSNAAALRALKDLALKSDEACGLAKCAPCEAPPGPATCTAAGSCEYAPIRPEERSCKVGDVIYPSGSSGIPKPGDCNTCSCVDGQLTSCSKKACTPESACPMGTVAATQCAECGPTDACQVVEHACLPTCTGACASGVCATGICRTLCG